MDKLIRTIGNVELRSADNTESRTIQGYAVVFDSESEDIGWIEIIHKGAITQELVDNCDVFAKFNHNDDKILARSNHGKGSLTLTVDDKGVKYEFEAPRTDLGDTLLENIRRGEIYQSSFAFAINPKDSTAEKFVTKNNITYRHIYHIAYIFDVAPVWTPAYPETSVSQRDAQHNELKESLIQYYDNKMQNLSKMM